MSRRRHAALLLAAIACLFPLANPGAAQRPTDRARRHLAAGEFAAAKQIALSLPVENRAELLAQVADGQAATGSPTAAASSLLGTNGLSGSAAPMGMPAAGMAGGGAIADFDSLMELIQTTVVPDTWEALGGPSTMSPYPAGVWVDPNGLIRDVVATADADQLTLLRSQSLRQSVSLQRDWMEKSPLRKVSLNRLQHELARQLLSGCSLDSAIRNLAGLSTIQYVFLSESGDDVILAGPVGGIRLDADQQPIDIETGRAALRIDLLGMALAAVEQRQPFGCTIEPTPEGIVRSQQVAADIQSGNLAAAAASPKLKEALGLQDIRVFGTADDTPMAMLMIQADRHMKMLALGTEPMPRGVANYMEIVEATLDQGPLTGSFLRMWFAPQQLDVRCDSQKQSFELSGLPLRLITEQQASDAQGERFAVAADPRAQQFAETFNRHFVDIARQYPLHDRLRGLYDLTAIAQLLHNQMPAEQRIASTGLLARPDQWVEPNAQPARQTESLIVHRRFRKGKTIHSVVVASGGVLLEPSRPLTNEPIVYAALSNVAAGQAKRPARQDHWWWD
ncbi:hypothetical protein Poly24_41170 [Rosistilla carotiformis]|uniref:DUF1598 domain-containing protein n=1 Tax=Rosistilla carotiformis TaxID=2528017 RepID=A0A518JXY3_9BACT|nr:DUF1598 domain-containing protein [Rosistilla carotiformis]QDV70395.1 hypothetical protein Poly24_41170 [Rosistilla carotiformis]